MANKKITHSNKTINWFGVPSLIIRTCWRTGWHGATKFNISWQLSVAGTEKRHIVFDRPSLISHLSLKKIYIYI